MKKKLILALMVSSMGSLSGCASLNTADNSEFACPMQPGVICKTPVQVYEMTEGALPKDGSGIPTTKIETEKTIENNKETDSSSSTIIRNQKHLQPVIGAPLPIREPARVMRIWIAPWIETKTDALHWPSYIYVEVEPRKWSFGTKDFRGLRPGIPLVRKSHPADVPPQTHQESAVDIAPTPSGEGSNGEANLGEAIPSFD